MLRTKEELKEAVRATKPSVFSLGVLHELH